MTLPPRSTYGQVLVLQKPSNVKILNSSSEDSRNGSNGKRKDNLRYSKCDENEDFVDSGEEEMKAFDIEQSSTLVSKNLKHTEGDLSVFEIVTARTNRLGSANPGERSLDKERLIG